MTAKATPKKAGLLEALEQEESKEEVLHVEQAAFNPLEKVASILSQATPRYLPQLGFSANLVLPYISRTVDLGDMAKQPDQDGLIAKVALLEVASEVRGKSYEARDLAGSVKEVLIRVALDIYQDIFLALIEEVHEGSIGDHVQMPRTQQQPAEDPFALFLPKRPEVLLAAQACMPYLRGVESRLPFISRIEELRHMMAVAPLKSLLKNKEFIEGIDESLQDMKYSTRDVFVYSILALHQDFFREMNK